MTTRETLERLLARRILVLDGAMGSMIQSYGLEERDFRGARFAAHELPLEGCNDLLSVTRPDVIADIHAAYLDAGADIIETNTFNATSVSMADYGMEPHVFEINRAAAELARRAVDAVSTPERPRFVAGSMGPTNRTASLSPDVDNPSLRTITFDQLVEAYYEQVAGLMAGGVDILTPETTFDTLNLKAALFAIERYFGEHGKRVPVMASLTITDRSGRTLSGQTVEAAWLSISNHDLLTVGINCALGPEQMRPYVEELALLAPRFMHCYPNAGLPNEFGGYDLTPAAMASVLGEYAREGWLNLVGGCCGTTADHIRAIAEAVEGVPPHVPPEPSPYTQFSGLEPAYDSSRLEFHHGRRAHQRHRVQALRTPDQERGPRGRPRRGAGSGAGRRQHPRRQHGRGPARLGRGHDHVPQPRRLRAGDRADSRDDRQLRTSPSSRPV